MNAENAIAKVEQMKKDLSKLEKRPIRNLKSIKEKKLQIQGAEAVRDIYTTGATGYGVGSGIDNYCVTKNSTKNYPSMVGKAYRMFENSADYGGELYGALVSSRVAFIGGEGPTAISDNKVVEKWANDWIKLNKLDGARNARFMELGEIEGKALVRLYPINNPPAYLNNGKGFISVQEIPWRHINYTIKKDPRNSDIIKSITYTEKGEEGRQQTIPENKAVYVQLGGLGTSDNDTVYGLMRCLSQVEAASRALYDLNHISTLFGHPKSCYHVPQSATANKEINAIVQHYKTPRPPAETYAGTAQHYYSSPGAGSVEPIIETLKGMLRIISFNSDLPMLMVVWPELMSNRATADTIMELINNKTTTPRGIWEGGYKEMLYKARVMSVDAGFIPDGISQEAFLSADIAVKMPLASFEVLKQILNIWLPLFDKNVIGKGTLRNMIPGIDPAEEEIMEEVEETEEDNEIDNENGLPRGSSNEDEEEQEGFEDSN